MAAPATRQRRQYTKLFSGPPGPLLTLALVITLWGGVLLFLNVPTKLTQRRGVPTRFDRGLARTGSSNHAPLYNEPPAFWHVLPTLTPLSPAPANWSEVTKQVAAACNRAEPLQGVYHAVYDDYANASTDLSPRCISANICDTVPVAGECGPDGLACVTSAAKRQQAVKDAMKASWSAYKRYAWGKDELVHTASGDRGRDWLWMGLSIVDNLDTLLLMGMKKEYKQARDWAVRRLDLDAAESEGSVFEINIRVVGGLLSAFAMSGGSDPALLKQAQKVADRMLTAYNTYSAIPQVFYDLSSRAKASRAHSAMHAKSDLFVGRTNIAASGTCTMEMITLSRLTGDPKYIATCVRAWRTLTQLPSCDGLVCTWFDPEFKTCQHPYEAGIGSSADSFYEEMLGLYRASMQGMRRHLILEVTPPPCTQRPVRAATPPPRAFNSDLPHRFDDDTYTDNEAHFLTRQSTRTLKNSVHCIGDGPMWILGSATLQLDTNTVCHATPERAAEHGDVGGWWVNGTRKAASGSDRRVTTKQGSVHGDDGEYGTWGSEAKAVRAAMLKEMEARTQHADATHGAQHAQHGITATHGDAEEEHTLQSHEGMKELLHGMDEKANRVARGGHVGAFDDFPTEGAAGRRGRGLQSAAGRLHEAIRGLLEPPDAYVPTQRVEHLGCFMPGLLTLGHLYGVSTAASRAHHAGKVKRPRKTVDTDRYLTRDGDSSSKSGSKDEVLWRPAQAQTDDDLLLAIKLMRGCYELYRNSQTGVAGDVMVWSGVGMPSMPGLFTTQSSRHYQLPIYEDTSNYLRPEVIESLFYLWRATHHHIYRDWGWQIFRAFLNHSQVASGAFVSLKGAVFQKPSQKDGRMESFFLAETLKYLYLLFSDDPDALPLDQWVFNTEAHPLPVWGSEADKRMIQGAGIQPLAF